jgi:hypothetical protein
MNQFRRLSEETRNECQPALPETDITGKRVGLSTETQALLLGAVRFPSFTPPQSSPFRVAHPQEVLEILAA